MSADVSLAARNNVLQSEAVLAALGSRGTLGKHFWKNDHRFDIPYANGATLGDPSDIERHRTAVAALDASRSQDTPTSIMDSWAALDLTTLGYRVIVADEWFVRAPGLPVPPPDATGASVDVVEASDVLAGFEAASVAGFGGTPPADAGHTYPAALLSDERFTLFTAHVDDDIAGGIFLFRDGRCTGVFTFFTLPAYRGRGIGTSLVRAALHAAPDLPLATNPSPMSRGIFARHGFRPVGERRIWVRSAPEDA